MSLLAIIIIIRAPHWLPNTIPTPLMGSRGTPGTGPNWPEPVPDLLYRLAPKGCQNGSALFPELPEIIPPAPPSALPGTPCLPPVPVKPSPALKDEPKSKLTQGHLSAIWIPIYSTEDVRA